MAWIETVSPDDAEGDLERQYEAAVKRAGKVYHVVELQSLRPEILRTFMSLYLQIMHGPSGLSRAERELVATTVSRVNQCHY